MAITTWNQFKNLPAAERVYLVEIGAALAANPATTATLYFSNRPKVFNGIYYVPAFKECPRLVRSLQEVFHGVSLPSWGDLTIRRKDAEYLTADKAITFDDLLDGTWIVRGRDAVIKYGGEALPYSEYQTLLTGKARRILDWSNTQFSIEIVDLQEVLAEKIVTQNVIAAGTNVPDASVGKTIPVVLGQVKNITPILIDDVNYTYVVHDGSVVNLASIDQVYDKGVAVGYADNGDGTFDLTASPVGAVTCDVSGAKFGSPAALKLLPADIAEGLLLNFGGFSSGDMDAASLSACNTDLPYDLGLYITQKASILDVLDMLTAGLPCWYTFTRAGKFRMGEFKAPAGSADAETDTGNITQSSLSGKTVDDLIWRQIVKYDRNWSVMDKSGLAGAVTLDQAEWLADEWRQTEYSDSGILTKYPLATEADALDTCLIDQADAAAVAEKWVDLLGTIRRIYTYTARPIKTDYELHSLVTLTWPRFGLSAGEDFRLVAIEEDFASNQVGLTLWG